MRLTTPARPWVFSRDPDSPGVREVLTEGGRATTVIDGWITVLEGSRADPLVEVVDVPMTLSGLSRFNVENALAAASASLAVGIDRSHVVRGLESFLPDAEHNPGRMNFFTLADRAGEVSVVMDLAHNEAGLEAMIEIMRGVRPAGRRILLGLGAVGDRQDELLEMLGEIAGRDADVVAIGHKEKYLRGRTVAEIDALLRAGRRARRGHRHRDLPDRAGLAAGAGRAGRPGRRGRADVPRRAPGGLRLAGRAGRDARHPRAARGEGTPAGAGA